MKTLVFVKRPVTSTPDLKHTVARYFVEGTCFDVCADGFEVALGLSVQPYGTRIEVNVESVFRVGELTKLA